MHAGMFSRHANCSVCFCEAIDFNEEYHVRTDFLECNLRYAFELGC